MTATWMDDVELDDTAYLDAEYDDSDSGEFAEDYDAGEDLDAESPASRRRRAQQRRVALVRRRQAVARARARGRAGAVATRGARPVAAASAATAIRDLDLESKVAEDSLRRAVTSQGKRMSRSEYAAVAGVAVNQFIESFDAPDDPFVKAALRFSPLLLLSPQKRGTGFEAFAKDPRVVGAAAIAGITLAARNKDRFTTSVRRIEIVGPDKLAKGGATDLFIGDATDERGNVVPGASVIWGTSNRDRADVSPTTGVVTTGKDAGPVVITATSGTVVRHYRLVVE